MQVEWKIGYLQTNWTNQGNLFLKEINGFMPGAHVSV